METRVTSATKEVVISYALPTVLIGERINPTGRKRLTAALLAGDLDVVRKEAIAQVKAGADILDVNVGATGVDEVDMLPRAIKAVQEVVDVPLCIDTASPEALEAALKVYKGKPILNSVKGEEKSLQAVLPIVKEYGCAVFGLTIDDNGLPKDSDDRVAIAGKIIDRAEKMGIPRESIIIDVLCMALAANTKGVIPVLEAIRQIREKFGVNQTLGASNISFNLPDREILNQAFLTLAISAGMTCPIVDAAKARPIILATDLALGRDNFARRFIKGFRERQQAKTA